MFRARALSLWCAGCLFAATEARADPDATDPSTADPAVATPPPVDAKPDPKPDAKPDAKPDVTATAKAPETASATTLLGVTFSGMVDAYVAINPMRKGTNLGDNQVRAFDLETNRFALSYMEL